MVVEICRESEIRERLPEDQLKAIAPERLSPPRLAQATPRRAATAERAGPRSPMYRPARGPNDGLFLIEVVDDIALGEPEDAKSLGSGSKLHYLPALMRLGWLPPSRECPRHDK
jgi:hypothetical protein